MKVCLPGYHNHQTNCVEEVLITPKPTIETAQPTPQTTQRSTATFITEAMTTIELINIMQTRSTTERPTAGYEPLPIAVGEKKSEEDGE